VKFVFRECGAAVSRISESLRITLPSSDPKGCGGESGCMRRYSGTCAVSILVGKTCSARYSGSKVIAFAVIQVAPRVLCSRPV